MQTFNFIMVQVIFTMQDAYHYLCDTIRWIIMLLHVFTHRKSKILYAESSTDATLSQSRVGADITAIVRGYYWYSGVMSTYTLSKWLTLWKRPHDRVYIVYTYTNHVYHAHLNLRDDQELLSCSSIDSVALLDLPKLQANTIKS